MELNPWPLDRSRDKDDNAVQQRRPHDRSNQKHKQVSDNEKTLQPSDCQFVTMSATPIDSTRQETRGGKGHPVRLCPSGMIVRWMKSEQSRPVMLTVICLVWIGAMTPLRQLSRTERHYSWCKELLAFVDSFAVDNVLPKSVCTEYPLEATSKSQSGVGFKGANGFTHQALWAAALSSQTSAGSNMNNT